MFSAYASSSIADSSAYMPGFSPGARMKVGLGRSSSTARCATRTFGVEYIDRVGLVNPSM